MHSSLVKTVAWHEHRQHGIGGSDAPTIMGLGFQGKSPIQLWEEKLAAPVETDASGSNALKWGIFYEDPIAAIVALEHPELVLRRRTQSVWCERYPWAFAHLDRVVNDGEHAGIPVEIKAAAFEGEWGESGTQDIPAYVMPQVQHEIAVADKPYAYVFGAILSQREVRIYKIMRDDLYIARLMKAEAKFWECVLDRVPPDPINADDIIRAYPNPEGTKEIDDDALLQCVRYLQINATLATLEAEKKSIRDSLAIVFGEHETLLNGTKPAATFKRSETTGFDLAQFQLDEPELCAKYLFKSTSRKLLVKK